MDYTHTPCPIRIVEDCGCGFLMGTLGGGLFQCLRGIRNAPSGLVRRMYGGMDAMKMRTPAVACNFAVWGTIFNTVDCALTSYRQREDPWNNIISGTATGGILSARKGIRAMVNSAIAGFIFLALLEGVGILSTIKYTDVEGDEAIPPEVFTHPQRAQWELVDSSPKSSQEESASSEDHKSTVKGFKRMLEKCQKQKDAKASERRYLLDLMKLAEII